MAKKKTSAEMAREESEIAKVEDMLGDAFGSLGGLEAPTTEENLDVANPQDMSELDPVEVEQIESDSDKDDDIQGKEDVEPEKPPMDDILLAPLNNVSTETISEESEENGHSEDHPDVKPNTPSGPPPASTPTGPPNPPSAPPNSPPSGPPSKGPPSAPPSGPPSGPPSTLHLLHQAAHQAKALHLLHQQALHQQILLPKNKFQKIQTNNQPVRILQ